MSSGDTSTRPAGTSAAEPAVEPRPDQAEAPAAPAVEQAVASTETSEKELLCTICGLRACWT